MDPVLRFFIAFIVFCVVAVPTFVVGLRFVPATDGDYWNFASAAGPLGVFVVVLTYGPVLLVSTLLGFAFAAYAYGRLGPKP